MNKNTTGILLINHGTPDSTEIKDLRNYYKELFSDTRVMSLPTLKRLFLLYVIVLPNRPKKAAKAYQSIWLPEGSPLFVYGNNLATKLQASLSSEYKVAFGVRYGNPSIAAALDKLKDCQKLIVLPLFPHYASGAAGSSLESVFNTVQTYEIIPEMRIIRDFYDAPGFIEPTAAAIKPYVEQSDHIIFSYHALPESKILSGGCSGICEGACPPPSEKSPACYRAQCFATSRAVAKHLSLDSEKYTTAFQSSPGHGPATKPFTVEQFSILAEKGVKNLTIVCPSFVADCLETLEELGIRAKEKWLSMGGTRFNLVPCLNDGDAWVTGVKQILAQ